MAEPEWQNLIQPCQDSKANKQRTAVVNLTSEKCVNKNHNHIIGEEL